MKNLSPKKQAVLAAVLSLAALAIAPVLAGGMITADVIEIDVPGFLPIIAPFIYLIGFTAASAALGVKGKKSAGVTVLVVLAICIIASEMISYAVYGDASEAIPSAIKMLALPFIFLSSPALSLVNGFSEAFDYSKAADIASYAIVFVIPVVSSIAFAVGMKLHNNKKS